MHNDDNNKPKGSVAPPSIDFGKSPSSAASPTAQASTTNNSSPQQQGFSYPSYQKKAKKKKITPSQEAFTGKNKKKPTQHQLEFALTVILVELATSDDDFDRNEYETICNGVAEVFSTSRAEIMNLIESAEAMLATFRTSTEYLELLSENATYGQKITIMKIIDEVIQADGVTDGFELYHRAKYARYFETKE